MDFLVPLLSANYHNPISCFITPVSFIKMFVYRLALDIIGPLTYSRQSSHIKRYMTRVHRS